MENNIKIVRLESGEDIIANYFEDEETGVVLLNSPMHIIFKRMPTGRTVMMMLPWLPLELIKDNQAIIGSEKILTMIEPKDELITYYNKMIVETDEIIDDDMLAKALEEDEDGEDEMQELIEEFKEHRKKNLH